MQPKARNRSTQYPVAPAPAVVFDTTPVRQAVRRLSQVDIEREAAWLIPAIQDHWNGPSTTIVMGWLRLWMHDNSYNVAITESGQTVGLAIMCHDAMDPEHVVEQVFLFHKPGSKEDGVEVYNHFLAWARLVKAKEFRFPKAAAETRDLLRDAIPGFKWRSNCYVEL